jgi:hypothetical protein
MVTDRNSTPLAHNLNPEILGDLNPDPARPAECLLQLRRYVESRTTDAIVWYLARKGPVARWSKVLRLSAIVLATAGAVLPLIGGTPLLDGTNGLLAGKYGYVFLALSGATVLLDRLFGLSSRWMRYMTTAMALQRRLAEFEMDWAASWLEVVDQHPTQDQRQQLVGLVRAFRFAVVDELEQETRVWVAEFQSGMAQLERQARLEHEIKSESSVTKPRTLPGATRD